MIDYTIHYESGEVAEASCAGKKDLINQLFDGDDEKFKSDVKLISWSTGDMFVAEHVKNGHRSSTLATADANPYGWRNEFD